MVRGALRASVVFAARVSWLLTYFLKPFASTVMVYSPAVKLVTV
jgi:hypothetical protein